MKLPISPKPLKLGLCLLVINSLPSPAFCENSAERFRTPDAAVSALKKATTHYNPDALRRLFGPTFEDLQNPDRVQATNEFNAFSAALSLTNHLIVKSETKYALEVGTNDWPFPVPIVKKDGAWFFDTQAGKDELLNRRIGRDELDTLAVIRAYVTAQREYASRDRDDDQVLEYAQKLASSPGKRDGLYWPSDTSAELSPLGPLVAEAQEKGYLKNISAPSDDLGPHPFHGYFFKILTRQGKHAPGGKYDYIINGHMIAGFALVAWPAAYGDTGVMTFIVNHEGRVYQQDLGKDTAKIASKMSEYNPDSKWRLSPD